MLIDSSLCKHGRKICSECMVADDAAKRAYDVLQDLVVCYDWDTRVRQSPWVALRLSDGGSDKRLYDTRRECVRGQLHENLCAYFSFRNAPNGFGSYRDAALYLAWHRQAYDNGFRLPDPDDVNGGPELVMPDMREHLSNQFARLRRGR